MAKLLDSNWDYYKKYKYWQTYYYSNGSFYPYSPNDADWFTIIKIADWLPTTKGTLANSSEIFLPELETVLILGDSVPYLSISLNNPDFIKDLGIKSKIEVFDDAQWQPECEPREIPDIEAVQWTNVSNSDTISVRDSQSELPSTKSTIQLITELQKIDGDEPNEKPKLSGIWGEKFAVEYLKRKFIAKYFQGDFEETQYGFSIKINDQIVVEVQWFNEIQETAGYDIKLIENDREDYIEVKSSQPEAKKLIKLSGSQWKLADELGENFHIYRVYDAGTQQAKLIDISNPTQLFSEGSLRIDSIYLRI